jgi:hypothetical protein
MGALTPEVLAAWSDNSGPLKPLPSPAFVLRMVQLAVVKTDSADAHRSVSHVIDSGRWRETFKYVGGKLEEYRLAEMTGRAA